jgi:two-component system phosphate regulon response regulator PhoB
VEDVRDIREPLARYLREHSYRATTAQDAASARKVMKGAAIDLVVLDIMMPGEDGLSLCRSIRETTQIPVILLTARGEEVDRIIGLEMGADDYIAKPFSPRVLAARVKALLRRKETAAQAEAETTIDVHDLSIHPGRHEVTLAGTRVDLTYTEFALLQFLARRPGWAFTRSQIVDAVKGEDYPVTERSVDVQVAGLRKKLGSFGSYIETVRGVGYRFRA